MKGIINNLDKNFESRVRLGIMSVLIVNEWVDFSELKELLEVTDGNLASHIAGLEKYEYIEVRKRFLGKRPNTSFKITKAGKKAFQDHLNALEKLLQGGK